MTLILDALRLLWRSADAESDQARRAARPLLAVALVMLVAPVVSLVTGMVYGAAALADMIQQYRDNAMVVPATGFFVFMGLMVALLAVAAFAATAALLVASALAVRTGSLPGLVFGFGVALLHGLLNGRLTLISLEAMPQDRPYFGVYLAACPVWAFAASVILDGLACWRLAWAVGEWRKNRRQTPTHLRVARHASVPVLWAAVTAYATAFVPAALMILGVLPAFTEEGPSVPAGPGLGMVGLPYLVVYAVLSVAALVTGCLVRQGTKLWMLTALGLLAMQGILVAGLCWMAGERLAAACAMGGLGWESALRAWPMAMLLLVACLDAAGVCRILLAWSGMQDTDDLEDERILHALAGKLGDPMQPAEDPL